jgi:ribosomal protein L39E
MDELWGGVRTPWTPPLSTPLIKTLNTLLRGLKERHWRQSDAIPGGPFKDVRGHKRLLEKERLASASLSMHYQHRALSLLEDSKLIAND